MEELIRFEGTSISINNNEVYANRKQVQELYNVPRKTLEDNIKKLKSDGLVTGRNFAISSEKSQRSYESEIYDLDEIISIGLRLRSDKAIVFQKWAREQIKRKLIEANQQLRMQQAQLDFYWDREDQKDLYFKKT